MLPLKTVRWDRWFCRNLQQQGSEVRHFNFNEVERGGLCATYQALFHCLGALLFYSAPCI